MNGDYLNRKCGVNARHPLYHWEGCWFHVLKEFPGAYFDNHGYILFQTEDEYIDYANKGYLKINYSEDAANVPTEVGDIKNIPGYVQVIIKE